MSYTLVQLLLPQEPVLGREISSFGSCHTSDVQYSPSAKELRRKNVAQSVGFTIGIAFRTGHQGQQGCNSTVLSRQETDLTLIIQNIAHPKMDRPTGAAFQNSCWPGIKLTGLNWPSGQQLN